MLMGPVFRAELLRTGRQKRYYVLRLTYGLVLLLVVWTGYERLRWSQPVVSMADLASFATNTFIAFATVQLAMVLVLVPALFGGAIADEKQRKTLHYLMASQLSGAEVILDKVLGRSAHLAVFVAIGLPIVSILGLFGGISTESVAVAYIGTFTTAAFAVALTVLISTSARRVRDAVVTSYLLVLMWLLVPPLIMLFGSALRIPLYSWIEPVNDWLVDSSPFGTYLKVGGGFRGMRGRTPLEDQFLMMVALQLSGALLLLLVAIWRLRPIFRRQEETPARRTWFRPREGRRRSRWFTHPACGDDPVMWKERYFAPVDRFTRVVLLPAIIFITLPLALMTEVEGRLGGVLLDFFRHGPGARTQLPVEFLWALQIDLAWYSGFWLLAVAGAAASAVTVEREKDTWASLTATPLTGGEILRGKVMGAVWNQRGFAAVVIFLWALALITGAAHPVGVLASILMVGLLTWLVATMGLYMSLRAFSTSRALGSSLVLLSILNGYPIILFLWFIGSISWESSYSMLGAMPTLAARVMFSPATLQEAKAIAGTPGGPAAVWMILAGIGLGVLFVYAGTAATLTRRILLQFDKWLDRPPLLEAGPTKADRTLEEAAVG